MKRPPLTTARLHRAIETRIAKVQESLDAFRGSDNPQVRELYLNACGEMEALTMVSDAIKQRTVYYLEVAR